MICQKSNGSACTSKSMSSFSLIFNYKGLYDVKVDIEKFLYNSKREKYSYQEKPQA